MISIITIDEINGYNILPHDPEAYQDEKKARKRFAEIKEEGKMAFGKEIHDGCYDVVETGNSITIAPMDEFSETHWVATLHEVELQ